MPIDAIEADPSRKTASRVQRRYLREVIRLLIADFGQPDYREIDPCVL
jgi:hypothetical protein